MRPLVCIGGGGHCKVCIEIARGGKAYEPVGVLDPSLPPGTLVNGVPVLGGDGEISRFIREGAAFLVAVGQIRDPGPRRRLHDTVAGLGGELAVVVSPRATVADAAKLGPGTLVAHGAVVGPDAVVGKNGIVNTMALVEHDAVIGAHCHLATGCRINGGATVGDGTFIGSGAVVVQGVRLGPGVVLGACSLAISDLPEPGIYVGTPARRIA